MPNEKTFTVNETILACPETVSVFNRFGVDACCRGDATLEQAALETGIDLSVLLSALGTVTNESAPSAAGKS